VRLVDTPGRYQIALGRGPPQEGADARQELLEREWLEEVVVGARVEPGDAIPDGVAGGEHQDLRSVSAEPHAPAGLDAVHARHQVVEHDGVGRPGVQRIERLPAVGGEGDSCPLELLAAVGLGFAFATTTIAAVSGIQDHEQGLASGLINTSQQIGGALGLAVLATIANSRTDSVVQDAGGDPAALPRALVEGFPFRIAQTGKGTRADDGAEPVANAKVHPRGGGEALVVEPLPDLSQPTLELRPTLQAACE
jgi:hypothetical protein